MKKIGITKKIVSLFLAMTLLFSTVPVYAAEPHWEMTEGGWRYYDENGDYVVSSWIEVTETDDAGVETTTYYFINADGYMVTGWADIEGSRYYFNSEGARITGWYQEAGKWYYFDAEGKMVTGWVHIEEDWYYMDASGEMLTGWQKVNGAWKYFNSEGKWIDDDSAIQNTITGIDVSYWQGTIDWDAVKAEGIQFTFIRVGHGERKLDTKFVENIKEANRVGIPAGVYFYSTAQSVEQAILDAQFVIDSIKGYTISYPVVIDMEDASQVNLGKQAITDMIIAFCDEIEAAGYTPMIYCNENWYKNYIDFEQLGDIERWIARYSVKGSSNIERDIWQAGSTTRLNGINGNVDIDFAYTNYSKIITPRTEAVSTYQKTTGLWKQDATGYWFVHLDGTYTTNGWENINNKWYYFDAKGYMLTEQWMYLDNKWYYVDEDGTRAEGWKAIGDSWYYFDANGVMQTGWAVVNGKWYYFGGVHDGAMKSGWQWLNNNWYYLGDANDGAMKTGWQYIGGKWYYFGDANDGAMKYSWQYIGNKWYYLSGSIHDGAMKTGWQWIDGDWYYMDETGSGAMQTGWQYVGGKWYYMYEWGNMAHSTWIDNYYVDASGAWTQTR